MSNFQRILNMASKALDKSGSSSSGAGGKTDWRDLVRTAADKVTGDTREPGREPMTGSASPASSHRPPTPAQASDPADRAAIARYDYLLKTADPEQLEQVHSEAFARLTPAQREQVEARLRADLPAGEQPRSSSPDQLARAAVRGEARQPGFLRGLFAKSGGRPGGGAMAGAVAGAGIGAAGGLLAAVAGGAVLSSVAAPLLEQAAGLGVDFDSFAGGLDEFTAGAGDYVGGFGDEVTGIGDQITELGSGFEIPGLGGLGNLFDR